MERELKIKVNTCLHPFLNLNIIAFLINAFFSRWSYERWAGEGVLQTLGIAESTFCIRKPHFRRHSFHTLMDVGKVVFIWRRLSMLPLFHQILKINVSFFYFSDVTLCLYFHDVTSWSQFYYSLTPHFVRSSAYMTLHFVHSSMTSYSVYSSPIMTSYSVNASTSTMSHYS